MNKNCFSVIFNQKLNCLVVVSELAKRLGKEKSSARKTLQKNTALFVRFKPLYWALLLSLYPMQIWAEPVIRADQNIAPHLQPQIQQTANGLPQIDIQRPSEAGVSRNLYSQFDVNQAGAILNNSYDPSQTQLAGWVRGNPNLVAGEAKVILNEVNSPHASQLKGMLEVAGQKADVIIANPSGLYCDGCGVINAGRSTFTTGTANMQNGAIESLNVQGGTVVVAGKGLDNRQSDYSEILAKEAKIEAGIWAKDLKVVAGKNQFKGKDLQQIQETKAQNSEQPQGYAIDVSELGGMYAGKIHLVDTGTGLGVRNAGNLGAMAGNVQIDANGNILNTGQIQAQQQALIKGKNIENKGKIETQGSQIKLQAQQQIQQHGSIFSESGDLNLQAKNIEQQGASLAGGNLNYQADTIQIENKASLGAGVAKPHKDQGGAYQLNPLDSAGKKLTIKAQKQLKSAGQHLASNSIEIESAQLDLSHSQHLANQIAIKAQKGAINLDQALVYAEQKLNLHTPQQLSSQQAKLEAGEFALKATQLDNQQGSWLSKSKADFNLQGLNQLNNQGGKLISAGKLSVQSQQINNEQGKIGAQGNLSLTAKYIFNPSGIAQAQNIHLQTDNLQNQAGSIYAENIQAQIEQRLNNHQGEILALNNINIQSPSKALIINNEQGKIASNNQLDIQAKSLEQQGNIATQGDLNLNLKDSLSLKQPFVVANNLSMNVEQDFINETQQQAKNIHIQANKIENKANAEINALNTQLTSNKLINRGIIDSDKNIIKTGSLTNIGTGRIYGNQLAIQAKQLNNLDEDQQSATIGARERLDLGVGNLINRNHSLIFSAQDLVIGGSLNQQNQAVEKAELIDNGSANIEALGNAWINTKSLLNQDLHLKLATQKSVEHLEEHALGKDGKRYRAGRDGFYDVNNGSRSPFSYFQLHDGTRIRGFPWVSWWFKRETETSIIEHQDPAKILVAGNLSLSGEHLHNKYSKLLVGNKLQIDDLTVTGKINKNLETNHSLLINEDIQGESKIKDIGKYRIERYIRPVLFSHYHYHHNNLPFYEEHPTQHFNFGLQLTEVGKPISTENNLEERKAQDLKTLEKNTALQQLNSGQVKNNTGEEIKTHLPDIHLPQASLYKINPEAESHYLIETDPRFTDRRQWLSSDYMFNALRSDPQNMLKRLGDGFYEQRLINEQINQLTGRRFLQGYLSDYEQYKALMDSGVQYAKRFKLQIGVELSPAQMKELSSDMVWLVKREVQLADGTKSEVLVPQVYLVARNSHVNEQGAVISANQIFIQNHGDIQNSGVIAGQKSNFIQAGNIYNSGRLQGDNLLLSTEQKLQNLGGELSAKDLLMAKAKQIEIASTSSETAETKNFYHKDLDLVAKIKLSGGDQQKAKPTLALYAEEDLVIKGADMDVEGNADFYAGKSLKLDNVETENKQHYVKDEDNYFRLDQKNEVGNQLNVSGDTQLNSGGSIQINGAKLHNQGDLTIQAKKDIQIQENRQQEQLAYGIKFTKRNLLSKTTKITKHLQRQDMAQGSEIDADRIRIASQQGNVTIQGSQVVAEKDLSIQAKNIAIQEGANHQFAEHYEQTKKSGLMGTGGIGFSIGQRKETTETDQTKHYAQASQVGSLEGNVNILAQDNYRQTASRVAAVKGDLNIQAKQVDVLAADDKYESNYKHTFEQKGLTLAINVPAIQAIQAAQNLLQSAKKIGSSKHDRINAMAAANTAWEGWQAGTSMKPTMDATEALAKGDIKNSGVSISLTYGQQKNVQQNHSQGKTANASQVHAGGQVNIAALGSEKSDINLVGSQVAGEKGTNLIAEHEVNLLAAEQTHQQRSKNKSSGWNMGVAASYGSNGMSIGVTFGGNYGKGHSNSDELSWQSSYIGSQNSQTNIYSQGDSNIRGAQVYGKGVKLQAQNLNIESLQDKMRYESKQMNVQGQMTIGYGVSVSAGFNSSKANADYAGVKEQAGIFAGEHGFDIDVDNKVDLKGAAIVSSADSKQNKLKAQDFAYTDIYNHSEANASAMGFSAAVSYNKDQRAAEDKALDEIYRKGREKKETFKQANPNQANASPFRFGLNQNDTHGLDFYSAAKVAGANLLANVSDSETKQSVTQSMLSEGQFQIGSAQGQEQIAEITKGKTSHHQALERVDHQGLENEVNKDHKIAQDFMHHTLTPMTDFVYHNIYMRDHRMMGYELDENGKPIVDQKLVDQINSEAKEKKINEKEYYAKQLANGRNIYKLYELSDQQREKIDKATFVDPNTGKTVKKYFVAFNGIFNDVNDAAKFAVQNYIAERNPETKEISEKIYKNVYFVHHPKSDNFVSELLVAAYQKLFEGNIFALGNSSRQAANLMQKYGRDDLYLGSHSRGTLTITNALISLDNKENINNKLLSRTSIKMVGAAANVSNADQHLSRLQGFGDIRKTNQGSIIVEGDGNDFIHAGRVIGNNPITSTVNTKNKGTGSRLADIFWGDKSPHNCYGLGQKQCFDDGYRLRKEPIMYPEKTIFDLKGSK